MKDKHHCDGRGTDTVCKIRARDVTFYFGEPVDGVDGETP